jgi:N-methylhydantoinase A/oxoprolinase/acetone carboxylase beta subunit
VSGPAVIEGADTTHAIPKGWTYEIDEYGNGRLSSRSAGQRAGDGQESA